MASTTLAASRRLFSLPLSPVEHAPADHGNVASVPGAACGPWAYGTGGETSVACRIVEVPEDNPRLARLGSMFVLATPGAGESCEKPYVCRLSPTEFVVTWERQVVATGVTTIECARIYKDGLNWAVDQLSEGLGYPIGAAADAGDADCNCRSAWVDDGYFVISHGTETANSGAGNPHTREYTLRTAMISWLVAGAPTSVATKAYTGQHFDDNDTPAGEHATSGGYLLSTIWIDGRGNVVVQWENRVEATGTFTSTIRTRVLSGLYSAAPMVEIATTDAIVTASTGVSEAWRRPNGMSMHPKLYPARVTSASGGHDSIWVYGDEDMATPGSSAAKLGRITQYAGAAMSNTPTTWTANAGQNATLDKMISANAVMGRLIYGGICLTLFDSDAGRTFSFMHEGGTVHERIATATRWPDRPSVSILPVDDGELLYLNYEGHDGDSADTRRWLDCYLIEG